MKYPRNEEEAKKVVECFDNIHSNGLPDMAIDIERDVDLSKEVYITSIEFYRDLENCHDAHVYIKSILFYVGEGDEDEDITFNTSSINLPDFIAAAKAIEAYATAIKPVKKEYKPTIK